MNEIPIPHTAPELWGHIVEENPHTIVALTGVHYSSRRHGIASYNIPLPDHKGMLLGQDLLENRLPDSDFTGANRGVLLTRVPHHVFAVSSLVYVWTGDVEDPSVQKIWAKSICYEQEASISQMQMWKLVEPKALTLVDFDCAGTKENFTRIISVLGRHTDVSRWVLYSGQSFHMVEDELYEPARYPEKIGRLILDFSETVPESKRHIVRAYGVALMELTDNSAGLTAWSREVLGVFTHYDEPRDGAISFILDMRHIAHNMGEFVRYKSEGSGGFGYLRVSGKTYSDMPPRIVAKLTPGKPPETYAFDTDVRMRQLSFLDHTKHV